jgi:hypothetical protein
MKTHETVPLIYDTLRTWGEGSVETAGRASLDFGVAKSPQGVGPEEDSTTLVPGADGRREGVANRWEGVAE